jgi:hypothetical protein
MKKLISVSFFALMLTLLLAVGPTQTVFAQPTFDVDKAIAAGDHQGLADYYKSQAVVYRQNAAKHDNMEANYKKSHVHYKGMENALPVHCATLKKDALNTADQYDAMAKEEEALIKKK